MHYYNLKEPRQKVGFRDAVLQGISSDMGLFMPETIPVMEHSFFDRLPKLTLPEIAIEVGTRYVGDDLPPAELERICVEAFDFPVVMREIDGRKQVLELFHGPTAAFKDFGARFMAGCFSYFASHDGIRTVVLVATSGDTGGAIASSFLGVEGVDVVILYPSGKVSTLQENQMATPGHNITAIEVEGTFDDCQAMVKAALTTMDTGNKIRLTSANSINIARLIPQSFYYYYAVGRAGAGKVVSVPSGNFGNITAAAMAWRSGLGIEHLVAATNINKVVPEYLSSGLFRSAASLQTIASAMDVGNPGNFPRLTRLFDDDFCRISEAISGYWFDDGQIREHIKAEYERTGYILDPHGAVASLGLDSFLMDHPEKSGIFVETAHPGKFTTAVEPLIEKEVELPESIRGLPEGQKESVIMKSGSDQLAGFLADRYLHG